MPVIRPLPDLAPGDRARDETGNLRQVIGFAADNVACPQTHVSHPGSRIVYATYVDDVNWQNPPAGAPVWEHELTPEES